MHCGTLPARHPTSFHNALMMPVDFWADGHIYMTDLHGLGITWYEALIEAHKG